MGKKLKARIKQGKLKIFDEDGRIVDKANLSLDGTLEMLLLKYGHPKKRK